MIKARTVFDGEADKRTYVARCEEGYEAALDEAVRRVLAVSGLRIVTLSGPTCSGKTTTARKLIDEFSAIGRTVHVISIDDFFYDRGLLLEWAAARGGRIDFDSPATIDMETLGRVVADVLAGRPTSVPRFDFRTGKREEYLPLSPSPRDVYIFEGIQAIYPSVRALFSGFPHLSVFTVAARGISLPDLEISPTELRLLRRLVRDYNFRGAAPVFTLDLWEGVRANEETHILPFAEREDITIDSTLGYELSALKPYLLPLLSSIPSEHRFAGRARELTEGLSRIDEISKTYIPTTSVFREFLG